MACISPPWVLPIVDEGGRKVVLLNNWTQLRRMSRHTRNSCDLIGT